MQVRNLDLDSSEKLYYLKNKDKVLATFTWSLNPFPEVDNFVTLGDLPCYIGDRPDMLIAWLESRTPPGNREHAKELYGLVSAKTVKDIIDCSCGVSLNDTLWVTSNPDTSWDSVSPYRTSFDPAIASVAFTGVTEGHVESTTSPEFGTSGMLPKCWVRDHSGEIYLKKGGTTGARNAGNEPYSEVLASQILAALGYSHVDYTTEKFQGVRVSSCKLITDEHTMMVPISSLVNMVTVRAALVFAEKNGFLPDLCKMFIFDYLSVNSDRHAGNISVMMDADTFEIKGLSPIYDNGAGMLNYLMPDSNLTWYLDHYIPALYDSHAEMAKMCKKLLGNTANVENLVGFKFDHTAVPGYSDEKIDLIEKVVQDRVRTFLDF